MSFTVALMHKTRLISFTGVMLVLAINTHAFAQDNQRRGFIGLGIGPSAPIGSFADTTSITTTTGGSEPGYTDTFVNFGYLFGPTFGVAAAASYSEYIMRNGGDDDWWQVATLTIGPMYSLALSRRAAVDVKAMIGLIVMTPVIDSYDTIHKTGSGLGVDLRATLRYDVFRRWAVFADAGVQASKVSFNTGAQQQYGAMISGFGVAFRLR